MKTPKDVDASAVIGPETLHPADTTPSLIEKPQAETTSKTQLKPGEEQDIAPKAEEEPPVKEVYPKHQAVAKTFQWFQTKEIKVAFK